MSRGYSKVSPRYWTGKLALLVRSDPKTAALAHALAFYLLTNDHRNMIGMACRCGRLCNAGMY